MKYLLESAEYEKDQTLKEICYDLTDEGFEVEFSNFKIWGLNLIMKQIEITKPENSLIVKYFLYSEIEDTFLRIVDYLGDDFIAIHIYFQSERIDRSFIYYAEKEDIPKLKSKIKSHTSKGYSISKIIIRYE